MGIKMETSEGESLKLEDEFNAAADSLMRYLASKNPEATSELSRTYELVSNYQEDPKNYLSKDLSIKKYIELQKSEKLLQPKPESFTERAKEFFHSNVNKILRHFSQFPNSC
eukprot:TRINITY_DN508_c0_g1_i6.p1 TRINITY_DN508_c0_g1~~TRINITY_DN508_c0_g1_i6.p1  ORF type:complete len:112 (-),score=35.27 TRINITY_DN508_c0_g1_i6:113-448(-)